MHTKEEKLQAFGKLLDVMDRLRANCPWNGAQTIDTLRPMTIEEVYELSDAVMAHNDEELKKELGLSDIRHGRTGGKGSAGT